MCLRGCPDPHHVGLRGAREITKVIVSSLKDHLRQRRGEQSGGDGELEPTGTRPSCHCDQASQRGRQDTSGEQELTEAREAYWWALATATILEECIERLSWSTTRTGPDVCHHSQIKDQPRRRSQGQSYRCCRAPPEEGHQAQSPTLGPTGSHQWVTFLDPGTTSEVEQVTGQASADLDLWPLLELGPDLECFLQELAAMQEENEQRDLLQGPLVEDYENWIEWRGCRVQTPNWYWELVGIPGINDFQQLAQKIQASFELPQAKSKAQGVDNDYSAPLATKCL